MNFKYVDKINFEYYSPEESAITFLSQGLKFCAVRNSKGAI